MSRRVVRLAQLAALVVSLALFFGGGAWVALRLAVRRSPVVHVPDVVGLASHDAEEAVRAAGLVPEVAGRRYDARQPEGKVLAQIPVAKSPTRPGRPVRLIVSLGVRKSAVPDVVGSSDGRAQVALKSVGLEAGTVTRVPDAAVGAGRVLGQRPPPGGNGAPGQRIDLLVSAGSRAPRYVMPDLAGRPVAATLELLARHGFKNAKSEGAGGEAPITSQEPKAGFPVSTGDPITLRSGG